MGGGGLPGRGVQLGQRHCGAIPLEGTGRVLGGPSAALLLERGRGGAALKEGAQGAVQVPQRLLGGTLDTSWSQLVSGCCFKRVKAAEDAWEETRSRRWEEAAVRRRSPQL